MRRRVIDQGFEALELPRARGYRAVPEGDDFELMQGGELPRRGLVPVTPPRGRGPAAYGGPFGARGLLGEGQNQNLGRSVSFVMAATANAAAQNILNLSGDDSQARAMTISLFAEVISTGVGDQAAFVRAEITWGSGGVQYATSIDFLTGQVFQLCASSLRIDVKAGGQGTIRASAHVGYEAVGEKSAQRTVRSIEVVALGATQVTAIPIPAFAKDLTYYRRPSTANCLLYFGRTAIGAPLAEIVIGNGPGVGSERYRIPDGARFAWIVNGLGAQIIDQQYIFGLCL